MFKNKRIWFSLLALVAFLVPAALSPISVQSSIGKRADGTAPPAPPIPNLQISGNEAILQAE